MLMIDFSICPNNNLGKLDKDTILTIFITAASNNDIEKIVKIVKYIDINQGLATLAT